MVAEAVKEVGRLKLNPAKVDRLFWNHDKAGVFRCLFSELSNYSSLDLCPVFRVSGVKFGNKAACGGALFLKDGTIGAMLSGPVSCNEYIVVDISAVKEALEMLKLAGWTKSWVVVLEIESKILLNCLANSSQRPWGLSKLLAHIDVLVCDLSINFRHILKDQNKMATYLAQNGLNKSERFQAWW
ncbi:hypothetical protein V6N13_030874 [Hibiscus sabdariffa]